MPTGTPLDPVPGTAFAHREVTLTGTESIPGNTVIADYTTSFAPISLSEGVPYWLAIAARGDFTYDESTQTGDGWAWLGNSALGPGSNAHQGGTGFLADWTDVDREQDFALYGVPEPGSLVLLCMGVSGAAVLRWRRKRN